MAETADERLIVMLEARISDFEKRMRQAETRGTRTYQGLRSGSRGATAQMERDMTNAAGRISQTLTAVTGNIGTFGKAFVGGLAAGAVSAGLAAVTTQLRATVKGVAELGDEANRAGLSFEAFQEWKFVAEQNRVSLDALTDGFKELNLRADEWIKTGSGSGAESFQRLGFTADDLAKRLKNPSELMLEIVKRVKGLDQAAQIRIFDELFGGTGGEQFVQLIAKGDDGLRQMIQRAHEVGVVLDENMIRKAQEIDRKFDELGKRLAGWLKTLAVGIADIPFDVIETRLDELFGSEAAARSILGDDAVDQLRELGALTEDQVQTIETLRNRYSALMDAAQAMAGELAGAASTADMLGNDDLWQVLAQASNDMRALSEQFANGSISGEEFATKMQDIQTRAAAALAELDGIDRQQFSSVIASLGGLGNKILDLIGKARELKATLPGAANVTTGTGLTVDQIDLPGTSSAPTTSIRPTAAPAMISEKVDDGTKKSGGSKSNRKTAADLLAEIAQETAALQAEAKAFSEVTGTVGDYRTAMEYAAVKAKLLTAMQQEGIKVTPELAARIDDVARAYAASADAADTARERLDDMQQASERGKDAIGGIFGAMLDGADAAKQALSELLMEMAKAQFRQGMMGLLGGAGDGLFASVGKALGFASGGYTGSGETYEPAGVVHRGEYVFSKRATDRIGVANLESLHRGAKGYAAGGYVAPARASGGSPGASQSSAAQGVDVSVRVSVDNDGNLVAAVENISSRVASAVLEGGLDYYDRMVLPDRMQSIADDPRRRG